MPYWFYVLMGCMALAGLGGIAVAAAVGVHVPAKARRLMIEMRRDDAVVQSVCIIRDGAMQCHGVAMIAGGDLLVKSVFDKKRQIPLSAVSVLKEGPGFGRCMWLGKRVFYLGSPQTKNLAIGVKDPEPWRKAFAETTTS
jgi:hypothetical protein